MGRKLKVCMFVYNNCKHDARVLKEAKTLAQAGYDVRIIAVLDKMTKPYEERDGFRIIRIERDPLHYRILRRIRDLRILAPLKRMVRAGLGRALAPVRFLLSPIRLIMTWIKGSVSTLRSVMFHVASRLGDLHRLLCALQEGINEKGVKAYGQETFRHSLTSFLFRSAILAMGILYWGVRRPIRFLWYRLLKRALYWGARRPARFVRKGFYRLAQRTIRKARSFFLELLKSFLMLFHKPLSYWDYYVRGLAVLEREQADIYHAHDLNTLPLAFMAQRRFGGKIIYDSHELYTETSSISRLERRISRIMEKYLIRRAHAVITVNESIANELAQRYKVDKPLVVMNCPPRRLSDGKEQSNCIQQALGLNEDTPIILYQGGFSPNRGLENLVLSTRFFAKGVLVLMGWGKLESRLRGLAEDLYLTDRVYFLDPVPQEVLLEYSASAHVGVIPYQYVGLNNYYTTPNKLFEYIASGLPVVGSNFPELKRIIEGYELGKTFNPDDPKEIANAINYVLSDETRYKEMKKNALKAAKIFNWENESKKLLEIYKSMEKHRDG